MHYWRAHYHLQNETWGMWDTTHQRFLCSSKEQPRDLASRKPCDAAGQTSRPKELLRSSSEQPVNQTLQMYFEAPENYLLISFNCPKGVQVAVCTMISSVITKWWDENDRECVKLAQCLLCQSSTEWCRVFSEFRHCIRALISGNFAVQEGKSCLFHLRQSGKAFDVGAKNTRMKHCYTLKLLVVQPHLRIHFMSW